MRTCRQVQTPHLPRGPASAAASPSALGSVRFSATPMFTLLCPGTFFAPYSCIKRHPEENAGPCRSYSHGRYCKGEASPPGPLASAPCVRGRTWGPSAGPREGTTGSTSHFAPEETTTSAPVRPPWDPALRPVVARKAPGLPVRPPVCVPQPVNT